MSNKKLGLFIGRFQVPEMHEGHRYVVNTMLQECDKVLLLIGSANRARSPKNPFSYQERAESVRNLYKNSVDTLPLNDYMYNDSQWISDVNAAVDFYLSQQPDEYDVTLYGHMKDGNDYLNWFPNFKYHVNVTSTIDISGTEVRRAHKHLLPITVQEDIEYFDKERNTFLQYPYPEALNVCCGDAVVECLGHILLVQRKNAPGRGTWALPGGHKHSNETFLQCILRELKEETNLRVPLKVLEGSLVSTKLFDSPARSGGLTRISMAAYFVIGPNQDGSLPRANGMDDALKAEWVPLNTALNVIRLYDDHADIISNMLGVRPTMAIFNSQNLF